MLLSPKPGENNFQYWQRQNKEDICRYLKEKQKKKD